MCTSVVRGSEGRELTLAVGRGARNSVSEGGEERRGERGGEGREEGSMLGLRKIRGEKRGDIIMYRDSGSTTPEEGECAVECCKARASRPRGERERREALVRGECSGTGGGQCPVKCCNAHAGQLLMLPRMIVEKWSVAVL